MAASSPVKSSGGATDVAAPPSPKCIKCGNVARSRPSTMMSIPVMQELLCKGTKSLSYTRYVLKGNSSFPDKLPSTSSPLFDQQSSDASHSGNFNRLRQLSNNFAQFSNVQTPFRSRKPLTKKDAQVINQWRFSKLKEFRDENIEAESVSFDRYMQNVGLQEEVFRVSSEFDEQSSSEKLSSNGDNNDTMARVLKLKLRSNPATTDNLRKRIQHIVDQGLKKVRKRGDVSDTEGEGEKATDLTDLIDRLNKAQNGDELKVCREKASQVVPWNTKKNEAEAEGERENDDSCITQESHFPTPKWVNQLTIDQEALCRIDAQFSSLEEVQDL
ncbi:hypothetical protein SASPL_130527 [Salvia splendens]|uniref:Uncharacterized protein n=1 Tax=Salvia splendens TaxID=180675 RepID=A0A8X8X4D3_SALSN|nr:hypothetical protein SASPL_130527 [Salvia splendens]